MIRDFWVENFYSIKDRQTLNFEAKNNSDYFCIPDDYYIYGDQSGNQRGHRPRRGDRPLRCWEPSLES